MELQPVTGVLGKAGAQLFGGPLVVEVELMETTLTDLREKHGKSFRVKGIILIYKVQQEGKVIVHIRYVIDTRLQSDLLEGVRLQGSMKKPVEGVDAENSIHSHKADVTVGKLGENIGFVVVAAIDVKTSQLRRNITAHNYLNVRYQNCTVDND